MINNDIYQARQTIIEATALNWQLCQLIWRFHPLGSTLIDMPITKALARGREITIQAAPDAVLKRFIEVSERVNEDQLVSDTMATSKAYGKAAIIVGQRDQPLDKTLDITTLNEMTFFNVIDPLSISGNSQNQDPNRQGFLQPRGEAQSLRMITVAGVQYNSSRFSEFFNPFEKLLYLNFNQSALSYAPPSVFERPFVSLQDLLENDNAVRTINQKIAAIIHKKEFAEQSFLEKANRSVLGKIVSDIKNLFSGGVAVINTSEEISGIDLAHNAELLRTNRDIILASIAQASSDGIPVSMLKNALETKGFGSGEPEKTNEDENILKHQKHLASIYHFFDPFIQRMAWNDKDWYRSIQKQYPEYQNIPQNRAIQMWKSSFTWEWNPISEPTEKEKTDDAKAKSDIMGALLMTAQSMQLPPETQLGLFQSYVENINDLGILPDKFQFDADDVLANMRIEEMEQQLGQLTNPQAGQDMLS